MMAGIDPHPAVKAISPQAPMIDVWMGDDFFHNGAFRQTYGYDYVLGLESSKETHRGRATAKTRTASPRDGYDYFLERGSFAEDVKQSGSKMLPTWKLFLEHPRTTASGRSRGVEHASRRRHRANAQRRRLLRPGRHVRAAGGIRQAGAARHEARELSRARPVAAWLLGFVVAPPGQSRTTASPSATSSARRSKRSSSRTI